MNNKIGIAILTCNRQEYFGNCLSSVIGAGDTLIVVNDGTPYKFSDEGSTFIKENVKSYIQHTRNKGICLSKNEALRYLIQDGCDHLFLIEDDMIIKNKEIFKEYIKAGEKTGIWHFMFGYHGSGNRNPQNYSEKFPKNVINYDGTEIAFNHNCVGSFCYYLRNIIKKVGYMDERFKDNCWEHLEHSNRIVEAGFLPSYWWWPDLANSDDYIAEQGKVEDSSIIRQDEKWKINMRKGMELFKSIHGHYPQQMPELDQETVLKKLERIKEHYARKIL